MSDFLCLKNLRCYLSGFAYYPLLIGIAETTTKVYFYCVLRRTYNKGVLLLCIKEDIPSRLLKLKSQSNIESLPVQIILRKKKRFLSFSYNPHSSHFECLNCVINEYCKTYDNFIFRG